ncbi:hypothetical protein ScPMuIL_003872 [Solemya velum]
MASEKESMTGVDSMDVSKVEQNISENTFTLEVLQIIKESQQTHGLRHGDYQRYRSYCTRRIRRLRKSLHFPQGNKHRVQPKKITLALMTDVRFLHLLLFNAERAWAYSMQLKLEANTEPRKRFHMVSRLRKAVQFADDLFSLCENEKCDARTKLECQAYNAWMKGGLEFELEKWKSAIEYYSSAQTVYEKLSSAFTEDMQVLYLQRVEEIAPNIRYCAYNIGDESALKDLAQMRLKSGEDQLTSRLDELLSQTREKQAATLSEVTWRDRTVPVKNEPVRVFLLNVQESSKDIEASTELESKVSVYESLMKECIDAQQVLRDVLHDDPMFRAASRGQKINGEISNQHYLHTYLMYLRLTMTVSRNLLLIEKLNQNLPTGSSQQQEGKKITKPQDLVRLYDIITQSLNEVLILPGLEEDAALEHDISVRILGFKAFRSFYIAMSYAGMKKWTEASALYERVLSTAEDALAGYKKLPTSSAYKSEVSSLTALMKQVDSLKYSCQASSILDTGDLSDNMPRTVNHKQPLSQRLDQYIEDSSLTGKKPNIVSFPPDFQPIPCRPLFFDLALNHVEMPSLEDKMEQKKGGGITGLVKGWLWGGGKK